MAQKHKQNPSQNQSTPHAQVSIGEPKKHGDPIHTSSSPSTNSGYSMHGSSGSSSASDSARAFVGLYPASIPPAEHSSHSLSAAAHLGSSAQPHTKPSRTQGYNTSALREPPSMIERVGKQHR